MKTARQFLSMALGLSGLAFAASAQSTPQPVPQDPAQQQQPEIMSQPQSPASQSNPAQATSSLRRAASLFANVWRCPEFVRSEEFTSPAIRERLGTLAGPDGFAV